MSAKGLKDMVDRVLSAVFSEPEAASGEDDVSLADGREVEYVIADENYQKKCAFANIHVGFS